MLVSTRASAAAQMMWLPASCNMDPLSVLTSCCSLINQVLVVAQNLEANKNECKALNARLLRVKGKLEVLRRKHSTTLERFACGLRHLETVLLDAKSLVQRYSTFTWWDKFWRRLDMRDAFRGLDGKLNSCLLEIQLDVGFDSNHQIHELAKASAHSRSDSSGSGKHAPIAQLRRDRLQILVELGCGATTAVYEGVWEGHAVAIKSTQALVLSPQDARRFDREVTICASLRHPNIVTMYGACLEAPPYLMVTELLPQNLHTLVHEGGTGQPLHVQVEILLDMARGMAYLHSHGVVHRNLHAKNVLLEVLPEGAYRAKIADFGQATVNNSQHPTTTARGPYKAGSAWFPPELIRGHKLGPPADVWGFALVCCEVVTRKRVTDVRPELPDCCRGLRDLIAACLSDDPLRRPTFSAITEHLQRMVEVAATIRCLSSDICGAAATAAASLHRQAQRAESRRFMVDAGAVRALVDALTVEDAAPEAAKALMLLGFEEDVHDLQVAAGVIPRAVALLAADSLPARTGAAELLWQLSESRIHRTRVVEAGAVRPLASLLCAPDDRVNEAAAGAIRKLSSGSLASHVVPAAAGAHLSLVRLLGGTPACQRQASGALWNLMRRGYSKEAVVAAGAIEPLVGLLSVGTEEAKENAAGALVELAKIAAGDVAAAGAAEPAARVLDNGTPRAREQAAALSRALRGTNTT